MAFSGVFPTAPAWSEPATPDFEAVNVAPPKPKPKSQPKPKPKATAAQAAKPRAPKPPPPAPIQVDLELVMLVDVSASVDEQEFALQRLGYVNAFRDPELQALIESRDGVAVNLVQWSGPRQQRGTGWMILYTAADCERFARRVTRFERRFAQDTVLAAALNTAQAIMRRNHQNGARIEGKRLIIDVSGDGVCENQYFYQTGVGGTYNDGTPMDAKYYRRSWDSVQKQLDKHDIIVNGISIGDKPGLKEWYASEVPNGEYGFSMHADTFEAFGAAIKKKLLRELAIPTTEIDTAYD
ncbi:MAG: DUF1194 domain-containing protein [Planctomycetota bacterium]